MGNAEKEAFSKKYCRKIAESFVGPRWLNNFLGKNTFDEESSIKEMFESVKDLKGKKYAIFSDSIRNPEIMRVIECYYIENTEI